MKWKFYLLFLALMLLNLSSVKAAYDFTYNGYKYTITDLVAQTVKFAEGWSLSDPLNNAHRHVVIPSTATNSADSKVYTVTGIDNMCFNGNDNLLSVFIPNTVTLIETQAFTGCHNLETVTFEAGNTMTTINNATFSYCNKLTSIVLPENITLIDIWAFLECATLKSVTLPNKSITINGSAFRGLPKFDELICLSATPPTVPDPGSTFYQTNLANVSLHVPKGAFPSYNKSPWTGFKEIIDPYFFKMGGLNFFVTDDVAKKVKLTKMGSTYAPAGGNLTIPSTVTNPHDALQYTVTSVEEECFLANNNLVSVFIPNSVTVIGLKAFRSCANIATVTFETGSSMTTIYDATFSYCPKLTNLVLPASITVIEQFAIHGCSTLQSITLPNQSISIGFAALGDLPALTKLICLSSTPPTTNGFVGYGTVNGNISVYVPKGALANYNISPWNGFKEILEIGSFTAGGLKYIVTDNVAKKVKLTNMPYYAPVGGSLTIPSKVTYPFDGIEYTVTGINKDCFAYSTMTSVFIPNTITLIDSSAFHQCTLLETITFEPGSNMTKISRETFGYCNKLTNIVLPENIALIEDYAFLSSATLKSVTLPNKSLTINPTAFMDLPVFEQLICLSATPPTVPDPGSSFYQTNLTNATLYVPYGATSNYQSISPWKNFKEIKELVQIVSANTSLSALAVCPNCDIVVNVGNELTVDASRTYKAMTIAAGGKVSNNNVGATTLTITNNLTIESNAANGTGTYVEKQNGLLTVGGKTTVKQYLSSARNWYLSSSVSNALAPGSFTYYKYIEAGNNPDPVVAPATLYWAAVTSSSLLIPTVGYIALPTGETTFSFATETGGSLNTGDKTTPLLTRTALASKPGFNLVGNPYPSYLNMNSFENSATIMPTVWIRSKGAAWGFDTYNIPSGLSVGNSGLSVTNLVPPMQAFWVRLKNDVNSGTLTFTNNMREHIDNANNKFRAPKASIATQKVVRLQVSNGTASDEAIVYFNENASDNFDEYDSPKMSNGITNIPEIYTSVENEQLSINGLKSLSTSNTVDVGFNTGEINTFSIKASELKNFDSDTRIVLKDKVLNQEIDLTNGAEHTFTSDAVNTTTRFSLIFRSPSITTGLTTQNFSMNIFKNANNQLTITSNIDEKGRINIYNALGQKVSTYITIGNSTTINTDLSVGVYVVTLEIAGVKRTEKIILN